MVSKMLKCPECGSVKLYASKTAIWSGRTKKINYKCLDCGRATVNPIKEEEKK
jgi:DNA-directed RNA polymerase subunit RPC12/RpoP